MASQINYVDNTSLFEKLIELDNIFDIKKLEEILCDSSTTSFYLTYPTVNNHTRSMRWQNS